MKKAQHEMATSLRTPLGPGAKNDGCFRRLNGNWVSVITGYRIMKEFNIADYCTPRCVPCNKETTINVMQNMLLSIWDDLN